VWRQQRGRGEWKEIFDSTEIISSYATLKLNKEFLKKFKKLKLIATYSTRTNYIDLKYCIKKKIKVVNVENYSSYSVAQHIMALILNFASNIKTSNQFFKDQKTFLISNRSEIMGFELRNKKIGILGIGNVGKELIKMLYGFRVKIIASDIRQDLEFAKKYKIEYVDFDTLISESDIISVNVPLKKDTKYIISEKIFKRMKDGVILINAAKGGLVNTYPLLKNLKNKKIKFVGVDTLECEDDIYGDTFPTVGQKKVSQMNKEIVEFENIVITPHNAYNTKESVTIAVENTVKNIIDFENNVLKK